MSLIVPFIDPETPTTIINFLLRYFFLLRYLYFLFLLHNLYLYFLFLLRYLYLYFLFLLHNLYSISFISLNFLLKVIFLIIIIHLSYPLVHLLEIKVFEMKGEYSVAYNSSTIP
jgi:hypothetical protein